MPKLAFKHNIRILYIIYIDLFVRFKSLRNSIDDFSVKNYFYMIKYNKILK